MTGAIRVLVVLAGLSVPASLAAQACLGAPATSRGWVGARLARTSVERNLAGVELGVRAGGWVTAVAQGDLVRFGDGQTPDRRRASLGVVVGSPHTRIPLCLTVSGTITTLGELTVVSVPIGVATGWEAPVAGGSTRIRARLEPRLSYRRTSFWEFHRVTTPFSLVGGSGLTRGRLYGGIEFEWMPAEGGDWAVGIRAAIGF